jgi:hypothetical protein
VGTQDISNENVLREGREDGSPYGLRGRMGGQGLFYVDGSYQEPLINLKVGPKEKEITFLVGSGAARSFPTMHRPPHACPSPQGGSQFLE